MSTTLQRLWAQSADYTKYSSSAITSKVDIILNDTLPDVDQAVSKVSEVR